MQWSQWHSLPGPYLEQWVFCLCQTAPSHSSCCWSGHPCPCSRSLCCHRPSSPTYNHNLESVENILLACRISLDHLTDCRAIGVLQHRQWAMQANLLYGWLQRWVVSCHMALSLVMLILVPAMMRQDGGRIIAGADISIVRDSARPLSEQSKRHYVRSACHRSHTYEKA